MKIVALIPAYNEQASIADTIEALLNQKRVPDQIIVIANNCRDRTYEIAKSYPVTAVDMPVCPHKKSGALNAAWQRYATDADLVICLDADTILPPNAIGDWEQEFIDDPKLAGSSSKFTMLGGQFLVRLQRAEFARWTDSSLKRGWTSVLAGTGCAIRGSVLREIADRTDREGPWVYTSLVEDFELTYRIRELGLKCHVSPTVRAYTDSMRTVKSLWAQRMKWQAGTVDDLLRIGVNRLTFLDWFQQAQGLLAVFIRLSWILLTIVAIVMGVLHFQPLWLLAPVIFVANDIKQSFRIPHRDKADVVLAALLLPQELFAWLRAGWFITSWFEVIIGKVTKRQKDRWSLQYSAEGVS